MKKSLLLFSLLFIVAIAKAQTVTSVCSGDSVSIALKGYINGSTINWQQSADSVNWFNMGGETSSVLKIKVTNKSYYRAQVKETGANCNTYTSSVTAVKGYSWSASLAAATVNSQTVGAYTFSSSSKLKLSWAAPSAYSVDHYEFVAVDSIISDTITQSIASSKTSDTLKYLKSGSGYTIHIKACGNSDCSDYLYCNNYVTATTPQEYWQLQGVGDSVGGLTKLISDGNTLNHAFVYGDWYPSKQGYVRYYYNPMNLAEKGQKPALSSSAQDGTLAKATSFTAVPGYGLIYSNYTPGGSTPYIPKFIGQACAVPYNGKIRLYYESVSEDNKTRIYYIDSKDGYVGEDFDSSSTSTSCSTNADFTPGGGCEYTTVMGASTNVSDVRQFKFGYPTMDTWLWKGQDKTFMAVTFDLESTATCGNTYKFTTGYAVYDSINGDWELQYNGNCPLFWDGMQAPSIVHLGGNRYKIYFNANQILKGNPHNPQTDTKPMKVIYATASNGAFPDFSDWETLAQGRDLIYLWPDQTMLTETQESKLDDYHFFSPSSDLDFMVQYTTISTGTSIPIVATSLLLNP